MKKATLRALSPRFASFSAEYGFVVLGGISTSKSPNSNLKLLVGFRLPDPAAGVEEGAGTAMISSLSENRTVCPLLILVDDQKSCWNDFVYVKINDI